MMDPPWLWNPWVESTEVQDTEYQWLHKMVTCHRKKLKRKKKEYWHCEIILLVAAQIYICLAIWSFEEIILEIKKVTINLQT